MTKEEAKKKLKAAGYQVTDDNSVVTVLIPEGSSMKNSIKDVRDKLTQWGYNASFSIRQHKGEFETDMSEVTEEADAEDADIVAADIPAEDVEAKPIAEKIPASVKEEKASDTSDASKESAGEWSDEDYFDEEDSDMLLNENSIQFSLEDFGLDF